jgi:hypothetical protein
VVEKDHYTNEVIQQKREYVAMRRDMAIRSMVEVTSSRRYKSLLVAPVVHADKSVTPCFCSLLISQVRSLFDAAKENRPAPADPTAIEIRAAELRQHELELSSCPGRKGGSISSSSASAGMVSGAPLTLYAAMFPPAASVVSGTCLHLCMLLIHMKCQPRHLLLDHACMGDHLSLTSIAVLVCRFDLPGTWSADGRSSV